MPGLELTRHYSQARPPATRGRLAIRCLEFIRLDAYQEAPASAGWLIQRRNKT